MAASLEQLSSLLDEMELKHHVEEKKGMIVASFGMKKYQDKGGNRTLLVFLHTEENGEFLKVVAPRVYQYMNGPHKLAVLQTCLMICWRTKMLQYEYDDTDGEIRAIIEFPLEDAELTRRQLERCLTGLVHLVDKYDPVMRKAMETGKIDFPGMPSHLARLAELAEALESMTSGDGDVLSTLEEVLEHIRKEKERKGDDDRPPASL